VLYTGSKKNPAFFHSHDHIPDYNSLNIHNC